MHRPRHRSGDSLSRVGSRGLRAKASLSALTLVASLVAMVAPLTVANAAIVGGYDIGGDIPNAGAAGYDDPFGSVQELGPKNGSSTKLEVINRAAPPMLGYTNPNSDSDLKNIWLDAQPVGNDEWLYFAWERESSAGTSVILYEFQQQPKPAGCNYDGSEATLVASCNPWSNRSAGDFVLSFDQQGNSVVVTYRTFSGAGKTLTLGGVQTPAAGTVATHLSADGTRGEAAINLSQTIFALRPGQCTSVANVIAGTVTGNSDTADYKDTVLPRTALPSISSCGTVTVTKETLPDAALTGTFPVTLSRVAAGAPVQYGPTRVTATETLTAGGETVTFSDVVAGSDYKLAETVPAGWDLIGMECGGTPITAADTFQVQPGKTVACTVTNQKQIAALELEKSVSPTTYAAAGTVLTYTFKISNSGNVPLDGPVSIDDPMFAAVACTQPPGPPVGALAVGASVACTATYTTDDDDVTAGEINNTATASAFRGLTEVTSKPASAIARSTAKPAVTLTKSSVKKTYSAVGDEIVYDYVVTNVGAVSLTGLVVRDDKIATVPCLATALAPGAFTTCTATAVITQAHLNAGELINEATAETAQVTSAPVTYRVTAEPLTGLVLDKEATTPAAFDALPHTLSYTYDVTNTGNQTLVFPVTVADDKVDPLGEVDCPSTLLAPLETLRCTATYAVTQDDLDIGSVTNVAKATAGGTTSNQDEVTVDAVQDSELTVVKAAEQPTYGTVGERVEYGYVVTNTGNVTLIGPFSIDDDKSSNEACVAPDTLAPNETFSCGASTVITQQHLDDGTLTNNAWAFGFFDGAEVKSLPDDATVNATTISLVKTPSRTTYSTVGDTVVYTYVVTNTGTVPLVGPLTVADDKLAVVDCPDTSLAVGATLTCTATATITQADITARTVLNEAVATVPNPVVGGAAIASAPAFARVNYVAPPPPPVTPRPSLSITKTPSPLTYASVGQEVDYVYVLGNTGNVSLTGPFSVTDDKTAVTCPSAATLGVGATLTCTATYTVTQADLDAGSITNAAFASGRHDGSTVLSPTVTATVDAVPASALRLVKVAASPTYAAIGPVGYTYAVTNTGNTTLAGPIAVDDDKTTVDCPDTASLAPGATITCDSVYTVTQADLDAGSVTNLAQATNGTVDSNQDAETITAVQAPALVLTKVATPLLYLQAGDAITYSYVMTNSGNVTLAGPFTVDDDKTPVTCPTAASLAPGASLTCSATYAVTAADVTAGSVTNVATATNGTVRSPEVSATVTRDTPVVLPNPPLTSSAPPVAAPPPAAPGPTAQAPSPRQLPFTGAWLLPALLIGSTALLLGGVLVTGARRRELPEA